MSSCGVCLSVCLSVTFVHSVEMNKYICNFLQSGSQAILVFPHETSWHHSDGKGIRTQAFEWYQFEWSCVISNPDFKVTILIQRQITQKQYKILLYLYWLQWRTYRKSYDLSNGAIFNDLEQPLTRFSRSRYTLTPNISQTVTYTAMVTMEGEEETAPKLSNGTSLNDLEWSLTQILRSLYYSASNNSKTVHNIAIFVLADQ